MFNLNHWGVLDLSLLESELNEAKCWTWTYNHPLQIVQMSFLYHEKNHWDELPHHIANNPYEPNLHNNGWRFHGKLLRHDDGKYPFHLQRQEL